jgi:four helix bundle protein
MAAVHNTCEKKIYDLEKRTFLFAQATRQFAKKVKGSFLTWDDLRQLIRASGSIGANYIEANGSLGKKDLIMRLKICRKEAKECKYWLSLIEINYNELLNHERMELIGEVGQLTYIFNAIIKKCSN